MKKVSIKYESLVFQEGNVDHYEVKEIGELIQNKEETIISFIDNIDEKQERTEFIFKENEVEILRKNYELKFSLNEIVECETKTEYGSLYLETKLKKYLKYTNEYIINYELLISGQIIGKYIIKIKYEELN